MKTINALTVIALTLGVSGMASATQSAISDTTYIKVGGTTSTPGDHPGTQGAPGIGVKAFYHGAMVGFSGLNAMVADDANGVTSITPAMMPDTHSEFGHFDFAKVSGQEVYFGEWSQNGTTNDPTRSVYYSGDDTGTTMPTGGTANYAVKGINNYDGSNLLTGTLTANFGTQKLTGSISNSALAVAIDATVNASTASFGGTAKATVSGIDTQGLTQGHFFGADAAALAGIATFAGNSQHDTAFGGAKQ